MTYSKSRVHKHGNGWRYKRRVPLNLQQPLHKEFWVKHFGDIPKADAERMARKLDVEHDDQVALLRDLTPIERRMIQPSMPRQGSVTVPARDGDCAGQGGIGGPGRRGRHGNRLRGVAAAQAVQVRRSRDRLAAKCRGSCGGSMVHGIPFLAFGSPAPDAAVVANALVVTDVEHVVSALVRLLDA